MKIKPDDSKLGLRLASARLELAYAVQEARIIRDAIYDQKRSDDEAFAEIMAELLNAETHLDVAKVRLDEWRQPDAKV